MKKFPKVKKLNDQETDGIFLRDDDTITVMEKIDGANFRWKYNGDDRILCGSRNVEFKNGDEPLPVEETNKAFHHVQQYLYEFIDFDELENIIEEYGELVFFGEATHKHHIDYDAWDGTHPSPEELSPGNYLGFDIWSVESEEWLPHKQVIDIHSRIGLKTVPVIVQGTVEELDENALDIPPSKYREPDTEADNEFDRKGLAEGIIIKNDQQELRAKEVSEKMKEIHNWKEHGNDDIDIEELRKQRRNSELFVETFITDARVRKIIHKLIDEGKYEEIRMEMMQDVPRRVIIDVFDEEGWNIINDKYGIILNEDIKENIRKKASSKCSRFLRDEIDSL